jgi:hypothetical protein
MPAPGGQTPSAAMQDDPNKESGKAQAPRGEIAIPNANGAVGFRPGKEKPRVELRRASFALDAVVDASQGLCGGPGCSPARPRNVPRGLITLHRDNAIAMFDATCSPWEPTDSWCRAANGRAQAILDSQRRHGSNGRNNMPARVIICRRMGI